MSDIDAFEDLARGVQERARSESMMRAALAAQWERAESTIVLEEVTFAGDDFVLVPADEHDPSEIIGHFSVFKTRHSSHGISFAWQNPFEAAFDPYGDYAIMRLPEIPYTWLRVIVNEGHFNQFVTCLARHLRGEAASNNEHAQRMASSTVRPVATITQELTQAARELGYDRVVQMWSAAQAEANADPDRAISLACTLVEEAGHHMLKTLNIDSSVKTPP